MTRNPTQHVCTCKLYATMHHTPCNTYTLSLTRIYGRSASIAQNNLIYKYNFNITHCKAASVKLSGTAFVSDLNNETINRHVLQFFEFVWKRDQSQFREIMRNCAKLNFSIVKGNLMFEFRYFFAVYEFEVLTDLLNSLTVNENSKAGNDATTHNL